MLQRINTITWVIQVYFKFVDPFPNKKQINVTLLCNIVLHTHVISIKLCKNNSDLMSSSLILCFGLEILIFFHYHSFSAQFLSTYYIYNESNSKKGVIRSHAFYTFISVNFYILYIKWKSVFTSRHVH